jgi:hypothetical protein
MASGYVTARGPDMGPWSDRGQASSRALPRASGRGRVAVRGSGRSRQRGRPGGPARPPSSPASDRSNDDIPRRGFGLLHGLEAVEHQVQHHLLQLDPVAAHAGQVGVELEAHRRVAEDRVVPTFRTRPSWIGVAISRTPSGPRSDRSVSNRRRSSSRRFVRRRAARRRRSSAMTSASARITAAAPPERGGHRSAAHPAAGLRRIQGTLAGTSHPDHQLSHDDSLGPLAGPCTETGEPRVSPGIRVSNWALDPARPRDAGASGGRNGVHPTKVQ